MRLANYPLDVYGWRRKRAHGGADNARCLHTLDFYYLSLLPSSRPLGLRSIAARPASIHQWENLNPASCLMSYTGYAQPGDIATVFAPGLPHTPPVWAPRHGSAVILLIRTGALP